MLDQRQSNFVKALVIGGLSLGVVLFFYSFFIWPIQELELQAWQERCFDSVDGKLIEKKDVVCSSPQGQEVIFIALGVIPFLVFSGSLEYFEKKRIKNWRSWR